MASASAPTVELPTFKGRPGWEFTDITELDLAAYERVGTAGLPAPTGGRGRAAVASCRDRSCPMA